MKDAPRSSLAVELGKQRSTYEYLLEPDRCDSSAGPRRKFVPGPQVITEGRLRLLAELLAPLLDELGLVYTWYLLTPLVKSVPPVAPSV